MRGMPCIHSICQSQANNATRGRERKHFIDSFVTISIYVRHINRFVRDNHILPKLTS